MSEHTDLVTEAEEAITAVFGDNSVPPEQTLDSLLGLIEHTQLYIDTIRDDLRRNSDEET